MVTDNSFNGPRCRGDRRLNPHYNRLMEDFRSFRHSSSRTRRSRGGSRRLKRHATMSARRCNSAGQRLGAKCGIGSRRWGAMRKPSRQSAICANCWRRKICCCRTVGRSEALSHLFRDKGSIFGPRLLGYLPFRSRGGRVVPATSNRRRTRALMRVSWRTNIETTRGQLV